MTVYNNSSMIAYLQDLCHEKSVEGGWYTDLKTGERIERNIGEMLALTHSELSETLEAYRKDLMSEKLPGFSGVEEELADALIRIFDLAGYLELNLNDAFWAKMKYNEIREDHKLENRIKEGGKKF